MPVRHVILDRDGVLNVEASGAGYVTGPEQWRWIPGALDALAQLHQAGIRVSIVTNQSGIGRGVMTMTDLYAVHERMLSDSHRAGARITAVYVCPHAPDHGCACRKPAPGLILKATLESGINAQESLVVGDDLRDLAAAKGAGVEAALVLTGKGRAVVALRDPGVAVYDDLGALTRALIATGGSREGS